VRTRRFSLFWLTYTIDFPVFLLFFAVILDIISTSLFVGLNVGTEANPILGELISISVWFIPLYLLSTNAIFVPFLSDVLRKTFSYTFGFVSILLAINNFSLVVYGYAFLIDTIGFNAMVGLFVLFGLTMFVYFVKKMNMSKKEIIATFSKLLIFMMFIVLIHFIFAVITWL
jgi:hypothetical protein